MSTSAENHAEQPKPVQTAPTRLYGQAAMNEAEKAALLQQARNNETAYAKEMAAKDPQHYLYNPIHQDTLHSAAGYHYEEHPLNQRIAARNNQISQLRHVIHAEFDSNSPSFAFIGSLSDYAKHTTGVINDQAALNQIYTPNAQHAGTGQVFTSTEQHHAKTETQKVKVPMPGIYGERLATNLPPDMLDMMDPDELKTYHTRLDTHNHALTQKYGSKVMLAIGLMSAAEAIYATPGSVTEKLDAASKILKAEVVDAIPGVTYTRKMAAGQYEAASLDAAGYLPLGDAAGITRSPEVQAVIDALPKDKVALEKMQGDKTQAPINRHLAETQFAFMQAKEQGETFKGLAMSSRLTNLAEQKLQLQAEWTSNAHTFDKAIQAPENTLATIAKNHPDIAPHIAIHVAMKDYPAAFIQQVDATLSKNIASGTPISPQMLKMTQNLQASAEQTHALTK